MVDMNFSGWMPGGRTPGKNPFPGSQKLMYNHNYTPELFLELILELQLEVHLVVIFGITIAIQAAQGVGMFLPSPFLAKNPFRKLR